MDSQFLPAVTDVAAESALLVLWLLCGVASTPLNESPDVVGTISRAGEIILTP